MQYFLPQAVTAAIRKRTGLALCWYKQSDLIKREENPGFTYYDVKNGLFRFVPSEETPDSMGWDRSKRITTFSAGKYRYARNEKSLYRWVAGKWIELNIIKPDKYFVYAGKIHGVKVVQSKVEVWQLTDEDRWIFVDFDLPFDRRDLTSKGEPVSNHYPGHHFDPKQRLNPNLYQGQVKIACSIYKNRLDIVFARIVPRAFLGWSKCYESDEETEDEECLSFVPFWMLNYDLKEGESSKPTRTVIKAGQTTSKQGRLLTFSHALHVFIRLGNENYLVNLQNNKTVSVGDIGSTMVYDHGFVGFYVGSLRFLENDSGAWTEVKTPIKCVWGASFALGRYVYVFTEGRQTLIYDSVAKRWWNGPTPSSTAPPSSNKLTVFLV